MMQIDTIEDLVRILDERPEWRDALRSRLLTQELLELPAQLARFIAATREQFEAIEKRFAGVDQRFKGIDKRLDEAAAERQAMRDDIGILKGAHARNVAERRIGLIARSIGLRERRLLDGAELFDLAQNADAAMHSNEIQSYVEADVVFEAENDQGEIEYVAVEVSYTANGRDTARAMRNSSLITLFTERPCRAVVASLRIDDRIKDAVENGQVSGYRLPAAAMQAA